MSDYQAPTTWPEKLREAARWFDTVDELIGCLTVEVKETGEVYPLVDRLGSGTEIQDDLRRLADGIERHDADREAGTCSSPIEFYVEASGE